ncbi:hypothetical protein PAERUG_P60_London_6_VIM_2_11_13_00991 [Pseudomonas aeruginosa]|nr:hypothetical protein YQ19_17575 [Pseudomonas aeruginosa]CDI95057.1 hypothetical protein BN889_07057 [Pseudomonas aeruginosa PA38182]AKE69959.1 hypothetical protein YQ19_17585 [Pseudomonas aeruginosa]AKG03124.1 hypothetical protein YH69_34330 [Pseudomonas aeruginosa]AKG03126.1 hypothetical protein YH69_34340 [Pseudomonas aeruginosa]
MAWGHIKAFDVAGLDSLEFFQVMSYREFDMPNSRAGSITGDEHFCRLLKSTREVLLNLRGVIIREPKKIPQR